MGTEPYDPPWSDQPQDAGQTPNVPPPHQAQWAQSVPQPQYGPPVVSAGWQAPPPHAGYGYAAAPPYGYAAAPPYGYPMPAHPRANSTNGMAIAGFVNGLCGLVLFWVPVLGLILATVGVVLSAVGLSQLKKTDGPTGLAVAGLALGSLGVLAFFGLIVMVAGD